jgi:hypothetical protein
MEQYYYLDSGNKQYGPVNVEDFVKYGITRETYIWTEGMTDWEQAGPYFDKKRTRFADENPSPPNPAYKRQERPVTVMSQPITDSSRRASSIYRERLPTERGFWLALFLSIVTLGIYEYYLIYAQAKETNIVCAEDNKHTHGLLFVILLSLVTFGIYSIVWECMIIERRRSYLGRHGQDPGLSVTTFILLTFIFVLFTFGITAIVAFCKGLYQQNAVNRTYNNIYNL